MPSPIGHALGGLAAGWLIAPKGLMRRPGAEAALFAGAGIAADLDLLVGAHRGPTHGLGAAAIAGVAAAVGFGFAGVRRAALVRAALAVSAAYGTHILLDWLGSDSSAPIGVMALWPVSRSYYESSVHVFMSVSRRYWQAQAWWHNARAVVRELAVLAPLAGAVWWLKRRD